MARARRCAYQKVRNAIFSENFCIDTKGTIPEEPYMLKQPKFKFKNLLLLERMWF